MMEQIILFLDFLEKYKEAIGIIFVVLGVVGGIIKWLLNKQEQFNMRAKEIRSEIIELISESYKEKEYLMLNYYRRGEAIDISKKKLNTLKIDLEKKFLLHLPALQDKLHAFFDTSLIWEHNGGTSTVSPKEDILKMKTIYEKLLVLIKNAKII